MRIIGSHIIVMFAVLTGGCSSEDCSREQILEKNQNGTRSAALELSGLCGGATVGYTTHLKLTRNPSNGFGDNGYVWSTRGKVDVTLTWVDPTHLEVKYPESLDETDVFLKTTRWFDVNILYVRGEIRAPSEGVKSKIDSSAPR